MDHAYAQIGKAARAQRERIEREYHRQISNRPNSWSYVQDIFVSGSLFQYPDSILGRIIATSTASNLKSLGYTGPTSERGIDISPFFTALHNKLRDKFGDSVKCADPDWGSFSPRSFKNDPEVIRCWEYELQNLIFKLLALSEPQS